MDDQAKLYRAMDIAIRAACEAYMSALQENLDGVSETASGMERIDGERHIHTAIVLAGQPLVTLGMRVQVDFTADEDTLKGLVSACYPMNTHRRAD
jgi:hypothetical protein